MVTNGYKMVTNQSQPCMQTHLLPARTLLLPCNLVTGHQPITGQLTGGLLCIVYIRSGSLYHMSVAIKMVKGKPVLISYKDELMLLREKMEAMKLRKKVLDDFKDRAHARVQKNDAAEAKAKAKAKAARKTDTNVDVFTDAKSQAKACGGGES